MTLDEIKEKLTDAQVLTLTLFAEARSEPLEGIVAVAQVMRNRTKNPKRFGVGYKGVCLRPKQFSCWNPGVDDNHLLLVDIAEKMLKYDLAFGNYISANHRRALFQCQRVAESFIDGTFFAPSVVADSTHYYSPTGMVPKNSVPNWADEDHFVVMIGRHKFYQGV